MSIIFIVILAINAFAGDWQRDQHGWWYRNNDGSYPASKWEMINGSWYHFNTYGYMETGWINDGGTWYYCSDNGNMAHDTWIDGVYYVGSNGAMYVNTTTPDGYKVGTDGRYIASSRSGNSFLPKNEIVGTYEYIEETDYINNVKGLEGERNFNQYKLLLFPDNKCVVLFRNFFRTHTWNGEFAYDRNTGLITCYLDNDSVDIYQFIDNYTLDPIKSYFDNDNYLAKISNEPNYD